MAEQAILRVKGYTKQFVLHEQGKVIPASQNLDFEVFSGRMTVLIGPTGVGKSSVLKGIYRTYLPTAGSLLYTTQNNTIIDLARADEHQILQLRCNEIAFVTQFLHYLPRQATEDVVAQPLMQRGHSLDEARTIARDMLHAMNLPARLWGISPATFSGGEKQRVNLARGLVARPRLLLLDEPTASLDTKTTDCVLGLIEMLKQEGVAMLAIFHQPELVKRVADSVVELKPLMMNQSPLEDIA
jgi:alpha-D-ribose 1-methylphosphonate 5-triphosphate synthase subunit PhnL